MADSWQPMLLFVMASLASSRGKAASKAIHYHIEHMKSKMLIEWNVVNERELSKENNESLRSFTGKESKRRNDSVKRVIIFALAKSMKSALSLVRNVHLKDIEEEFLIKSEMIALRILGLGRDDIESFYTEEDFKSIVMDMRQLPTMEFIFDRIDSSTDLLLNFSFDSDCYGSVNEGWITDLSELLPDGDINLFVNDPDFLADWALLSPVHFQHFYRALMEEATNTK